MKDFYQKSIKKVTEAMHSYWLDKHTDTIMNACENKHIYMIGVSNPNWEGIYVLENEHYDVIEIDDKSCIIAARLLVNKADNSKKTIIDCSVHCVDKDGKVRFFYVHMTNLSSKDYTNIGAFIGENQHKDDKYSQVIHGVFDVVIEYSCFNNTLRYDHDEYRKFFGMDKYYITADQWFWSFVGECVHPDDAGCLDIFRDLDMAKRLKNREYMTESEFRVKRNDKYKWVKMNLLMIPNDDNSNVKELYVLFKDIDAQRSVPANKMISRTDSLTLIWNKEYSSQLIERYLKKIRKKGTSVMLLIDVDDLKGINDTYGRMTGDYILTKIVENVLSVIEPKDVFGRYKEDSFILYIVDRMGKEELSMVIRNILEITQFEYVEKQIAKKIQCSIGATYVDEYCDINTIFEKCGVALKEAIDNGERIIFA